MTLAACFRHMPVHTFGKGYHCRFCGVPMEPPISFELATPISEETKQLLDEIDRATRICPSSR